LIGKSPAAPPWEAWLAPVVVAVGGACLALACANLPPHELDDLCAIFGQKTEWRAAALRAEERWGTPVPVLMAVLHQESRFRARAQPDWRFVLGVVPLGPASSAYGYGQVKEATWDDYRRLARRPEARRDRFADVVDFVGWYADLIERVTGVAKQDAYHLYLAYHEGPAGFERRSFEGKPWLLGVARKVEERAVLYGRQQGQCIGPALAAAPVP